MQIVITADPATGKLNLQCPEDRPWTIVAILKAVIESLTNQQVQKEAAASPKIELAHAVPAFSPLQGLRK